MKDYLPGNTDPFKYPITLEIVLYVVIDWILRLIIFLSVEKYNEKKNLRKC